MFEPLEASSTVRAGVRRQPPRPARFNGSKAELTERKTPPASSLSHAAAEDDSNSDSDEEPVAKRKFRQRRPKGTFDPIQEAMKSLTDEERQNWKGWVELESDPALFNFVLRSYGVKDTKVQEVFSLDLLGDLPMPVYGLIFLFKYRDDDAEEQEDTPQCPMHVWFANQTIDNACATIALLNIVMNVPDIDLGDALNGFKDSTRKLKPPYRGQRLGCDEFIRGVHNSFARRMEVLNADLALQNQSEKWEREQDRANKSRRKKSLNRVGNARRKKDKDDEPGYHFIAYVPIKTSVWRLDGLQRQPINIGDCGDDWTAIARDNILERIARYEGDGIEYSLMSLCKSPLLSIKQQLAENISSITAVELSLSDTIPDWKLFMDDTESMPVNELLQSLGLSQDLMSNASPSEESMNRLEKAEADPAMVMNLRKSLTGEQRKLRAAYVNEVAEISQEDEQAARRKYDYAPSIYSSIKALAEGEVLKEIALDTRGV